MPLGVRQTQGISDIITVPGLINVDFADVKAIMSNSGTAMLGVGVASGPNRAEAAASSATAAPLIQRSIERATGIVYNITGGKDLTLAEVRAWVGGCGRGGGRGGGLRASCRPRWVGVVCTPCVDGTGHCPWHAARTSSTGEVGWRGGEEAVQEGKELTLADVGAWAGGWMGLQLRRGTGAVRRGG